MNDLQVIPARTHVLTADLKNLDSMMALFDHMAVNNALPSGVNPTQAMMMVGRGASFGWDPATSLSAFHVISGKVTLSAGAMVAAVLASPQCKYFDVIETTRESCTVATHREGSPNPTRYTYTIEDAKDAGHLNGRNGGTWKKHPRDMVRARCMSACARMVYPDLMMGLYDPSEALEFDDVAPAPPAQRRTHHPQEQRAVRSHVSPSPEYEDAEVIEESAPALTPRQVLDAALADCGGIDAYAGYLVIRNKATDAEDAKRWLLTQSHHFVAIAASLRRRWADGFTKERIVALGEACISTGRTGALGAMGIGLDDWQGWVSPDDSRWLSIGLAWQRLAEMREKAAAKKAQGVAK